MVSKLKMNINLLDSQHNEDLIELASAEAEAEIERALLWAMIKLWGAISFGLVIFGFLTYKLISWYLIKQAITKELLRQRMSV